MRKGVNKSHTAPDNLAQSFNSLSQLWCAGKTTAAVILQTLLLADLLSSSSRKRLAVFLLSFKPWPSPRLSSCISRRSIITSSWPEGRADQRQQLELTYWTFRLESIDANTLSYLSFRNITNDDKRISSAHKRADLNCFTLWEPLKGEEGEPSAWVLMHSKQRKIPHVSKITSIKRLNEEKWHIIE